MELFLIEGIDHCFGYSGLFHRGESCIRPNDGLVANRLLGAAIQGWLPGIGHLTIFAEASWHERRVLFQMRSQHLAPQIKLLKLVDKHPCLIYRADSLICV